MAAVTLTRRASFLHRSWRRRNVRRWAQAAALLALLGAVAFSTFNAVTTDRSPGDLAVTRFLQRADLGALRGPLFWMGLRGVAGGALAAAAAWLWLRGHRLEAAFVALMLLPDASSFVLRAIFDRPRPTEALVTVYGGPQGAGYPSGTALHWTFFGGFMLYLLPKITGSKSARYVLGSLVLLWIPAVGLWLVHHGRHWPSDVAGGYLYGLLYLVIWIKLYRAAL